MTLEIKTIGKIIRELIKKEKIPDLPHPSLTPEIKKKILEEKPALKYMDKKGIFFDIGMEYHGYIVKQIIVCTFAKHKNEQFSLNAHTGDFYPIDKNDRIIKSDGGRTVLKWNKFRNKYIFKIHDRETPVISDKVMQELIGNSDSEIIEIRKIKKWLITTYYKGVILETVMHVKTEKNMTVIEDQKNLEKELRNSQYWKMYKDENLGTIYGNDSLSIAVWKYNTVWIITSNSSLLSIRTYLKKK